MKRVILIMHNDLMHYPPMISLIDILLDLGVNVTYIGGFTDSPTTQRFIDCGVKLIRLGYDPQGSFIDSMICQYKYKRELSKRLKECVSSQEDIVWYIYSKTANFVHEIISKYRFIIHYYEFQTQFYPLKYRLLYPSYNQCEFVHKAKTVIHCEYNRAQIFKGINQLEKLPYVLPNKPYLKDDIVDTSMIPLDILSKINDISKKIKNKKIILYQGIFNSSERKLDEFCQAISLLPEDFALLAMGQGDSSFEELKRKYESDRVIFVPFIIPPYHLLVTEQARIGVLSYSPVNSTFNGVINPLYCAPNKIFEYGLFNIPMISNDIPGLSTIFKSYKCGECVENPMNPQSIADTILSIDHNYDEYSRGAKEYYRSVDLISIVKNILNS